MSDFFHDTMIRSKGILNDIKIVDLMKNDFSIEKISTISSLSNINFDLIVETNSKITSLNLIKNGILLSDGRIAKIKVIYNEIKEISKDLPRSRMADGNIPFNIPRFPFEQRIKEDQWEEEQFNNMKPDDQVRPDFDKEPIFGLGNSEYRDFINNDPIFKQESFDK